MPPRKETESVLSAEDNDQVQALLAQYHHLAQGLHNSIDREAAENALRAVTGLVEPVQIAFLKALAKEQHSDAADIMAALNALSPHKEIRKEARRALIRLEATKTYPQWTPPVTQQPAIQVNIANPPRFWKGIVTQTREQGELQLLLCWEQGYDYGEARSISFLLDFWHDGVQECYSETGTKRHIETHVNELRNRQADFTVTDCTLAEGKRLLEEALGVNAWHGTTPHETYRNQLPLINKLIMQVGAPGEDPGHTFIAPDMEDEETVVNFQGAWSMGDYGLAHDLLSSTSDARAGLARDEWIDLHRAWYDEAHPARMELGFVHQRAARQSTLWLPTSASGRGSNNARKEIEIGWSLELSDTPLNGTLTEMPMGSAVNKETGRHWFWTAYTLVREQGSWRIQQVKDEILSLQNVSITELQARIKEYEEAIESSAQRRDDDVQAFMTEMSWRLTQLLYFYDALLVKLPLDYSIHQEAFGRSILTGNPELIMVYLERLLQRFQDNRVDTLRRLGSILTALAYKYEDPKLRARQEHLLARAEESLREALSIDHSALGHVLLGELFLSQRRSDEAEVELLKAQELNPVADEQTTIEAGLGNIALRRERIAEAIPHYERVASINPQYPGVWFNLGFAHRLLGHSAEAEQYYQQAIRATPEDFRPYSELTALYAGSSDMPRARALLEQGITANPESAQLHALLASLLFEMGDRRGAQRQLDEAESLDPELEIVQRVRQQLHTVKKK